MRLLPFHRTFLMQSVTLPGILAQEIQARRQREQIVRIGQIYQQITSQDSRTPSPPLADLADGGSGG